MPRLWRKPRPRFCRGRPASDVEGRDAAYKLNIMATLAFSALISMDDICTEGITEVKLRDIRYARELGYSVKLLAVAEEKEDGLVLRVHPALIPESSWRRWKMSLMPFSCRVMP